MILKALYDYYHALGNMPPMGMENKEIAYVVVIDRDGEFVRFESKRIDKRRCTTFLVAKAVGRTRGPKSNTLWDNAKYVFGFAEADSKCHELFVDRVNEVAALNPDDCSIQALRKFYARPKTEREAAMAQDQEYEHVRTDTKSNFSFQLIGDDMLIAEKKELYLGKIKTDEEEEASDGICLITGERGQIVRLHTGISLPGSKSSAALVSMQTNSGYDSYGKTQAFNAPTSKEAEFAYSAALKKLLGKDSRNKATIGQRTYLFWGTGDKDIVKDMELSFMNFLGVEPSNTVNPDANVEQVQSLLKSIWSGNIKTTLDGRFYILGLTPNAGRISVVLWREQKLKDLASMLLLHFDDMDIIDHRPQDKRKSYYGIPAMLSAVTQGGKVQDAISTLSEGILNSVMHNLAYPHALYTGALERIRAELADSKKTAVTTARAGIIKACVNRMTRHQENIKPLTTMLDKTNDNQGYLCGRLTAVLEKIQKDVSSGDSIRTRYMGAASATPAAVFPAMLNVSVHHSEKLQEGSRIYYERLKQEIMDKLPADGFPAHLDLKDQGRFFVGYYHQRADLFTKKENED